MTLMTPLNLADSTIDAYHHLNGLDDLSPAEDTNRMFSRLVQAARAPLPTHKVHTLLAEVDSRIELGNLHMLCAKGEFAMEEYWAKRIHAAANPKKELKAFTYWDNYKKLAAMEVKAIRSLMPQAKKVLFVGSGPLPLSSYIMSAHYKLDVENMDLDDDAVDCAVKWMFPMMGEKAIPCHHVDVMDFTDFGRFDVVIMAALVGLTSEQKCRVTEHLNRHMHMDQLLMVRSVRGLRSLLYPKVVAEDLVGFTTIKEVHPRGEVINSVLLARKAA